MGIIGPTLPPSQTAKRKRPSDSQASALSSSPKRQRSVSPPTQKSARIIGPAAPPAPLSELPPQPPTQPSQNGINRTISAADASDSSDDDDFGPAPPPPPDSLASAEEQARREAQESADAAAALAASTADMKPTREDWMLLPPAQSDWTSRVDPTKLKSRRFNTGKPGSSKPSSSNETGVDSTWLETPDQKRQRLEDEVLGRRAPAQLEGGAGGSTGPQSKEERAREDLKRRTAEETQRQIEEINASRQRGGSLMSEHKKKKITTGGGTGTQGSGSGDQVEKEDDPSARAFDREKDVGLAVKIGAKARVEMLGKAKGFGGRFSGGNYL